MTESLSSMHLEERKKGGEKGPRTRIQEGGGGGDDDDVSDVVDHRLTSTDACSLFASSPFSLHQS